MLIVTYVINKIKLLKHLPKTLVKKEHFSVYNYLIVVSYEKQFYRTLLYCIKV